MFLSKEKRYLCKVMDILTNFIVVITHNIYVYQIMDIYCIP